MANKPPIEWRGGGKVIRLDEEPFRLQAVFMERAFNGDGARITQVCSAGVKLPNGWYVFFAHHRECAVYANEQQALEANPGATIHRAPDADPAVNPTDTP